jgi:hypothetical protein
MYTKYLNVFSKWQVCSLNCGPLRVVGAHLEGCELGVLIMITFTQQEHTFFLSQAYLSHGTYKAATLEIGIFMKLGSGLWILILEDI